MDYTIKSMERSLDFLHVINLPHLGEGSRLTKKVRSGRRSDAFEVMKVLVIIAEACCVTEVGAG